MADYQAGEHLRFQLFDQDLPFVKAQSRPGRVGTVGPWWDLYFKFLGKRSVGHNGEQLIFGILAVEIQP